jgi:hypothetical protein
VYSVQRCTAAISQGRDAQLRSRDLMLHVRVPPRVRLWPTGVVCRAVRQVANEVWVVEDRRVTRVASFDKYIEAAHARAEAAEHR